jgi:hypothetical protein
VQQCPKCHYVREPTDDAPDWRCPSCGIAYAKFEGAPPQGENSALTSSELEGRLTVLNDRFKYRLLAALVAIPVFELSLYLALGQHSGAWAQYTFLQRVPVWVHVLYAGAAAGVGLIFGFKGVTWLLGHLFMTHFENERNPAITAALWAAFAALIAIGFFASSR